MRAQLTCAGAWAVWGGVGAFYSPIEASLETPGLGWTGRWLTTYTILVRFDFGLVPPAMAHACDSFNYGTVALIVAAVVAAALIVVAVVIGVVTAHKKAELPPPYHCYY